MGKNAIFVHHLYCPISVEDNNGVAKLYVVEEINDTKKFYLNKIEMVSTDSTDSAKALSQNSSVDTIKTVADLFEFVKKNNDKFEADSEQPTKLTPKSVNKEFLNSDGTPKVFYHGTPNGTFTEFRDWQYFTQNKDYAGNYLNQGASSTQKRIK